MTADDTARLVDVDDGQPCHRCGGPHQFDTSVPSVEWNEVIRGSGLPDYLCLSCIVLAFGSVGRGVHVTLWGGPFHGLPLALHFNSRRAQSTARVQDENNRLRALVKEGQSSEAKVQALEAREQAIREALKVVPLTGESFGLMKNRALDAVATIRSILEGR